MNEVELKFQVPARRREAVDAAVAGRTPQRRVRLQAAYSDTPDRALALAGMALRVRREGRQWVQTLKTAGVDGMTRTEHNVPLPGSAAELPRVDPERHHGTPAGDALLRLLADQPEAALAVLYRTDILRRMRTLRTAHGSVELAFDEGRILAGDAAVPVCELEIELIDGSPLAVIDTARRWLPRFGAWLDSRSKAERGDLLARGEAMARERLAQRVVLARGLTQAEAWQQVLRSCTDQIVANASQVASGPFADEHVHQLRVGLRRLRTALALFGPEVADPALGVAAAALFRGLGGARDQAVIEGEFAAELQVALHSAGGAPGREPAAGHGATSRAPLASASAAVSAAVRETGTQTLLLDLLAAAHAAVPAESLPTELPLRDALAQRLNRWHRRAATDAQHFADLDDAARHALRKRIKRLRYAVEFAASLFPRRAVRAYLRPLRALQERLGAINDVVMAMHHFREPRADVAVDPQAWFALGWLAARRDVLLEEAKPDLRAFAKAKRFWKKD